MQDSNFKPQTEVALALQVQVQLCEENWKWSGEENEEVSLTCETMHFLFINR